MLGDLSVPILNRAYAHFVEQLGDRAQLGSAFGEAGKTLDMIANRVTQLRRGYTSLKGGNFRKFLKTFSLLPHKKDKNRFTNKASEAGGLWLEYWMGWAPSVGDVVSGLKVLTSETFFMEPLHIIGRSSQPITFSYSGEHVVHSSSGSAHGQVNALVTISNPNLMLANRLGLLNPVATAWEMTPFSWLLGWAVNLEQIFSSWSDLAGYSFKYPYTTYFATLSGNRKMWGYSPYTDYNDGPWERVMLRRSLGIQPPRFCIVKLKALSPTRALTATSLLVQALHSERKAHIF